MIIFCSRINCDIRFSYVIIGGLGGVGLELSDWLVLRGAKKLVLVSRSGIQNGYQQQRIRLWRSYGVQVIISIKDVSIKQQCEEMITEANQLGPVDAVFNLAVVLKDALFEDQVEEAFLATLAPKSHATTHLDQLTRKLCPKLRHFVIFSSVSCGRGNIGQSNYGMANSIMERICEKRKQEGLPAVAIQWGAIGEVGLVAKMQKENKELVIGGTLQQKISSCLQVLDKLLRQNHPVVSSMVVAEKRNKNDNLGPVEAVASILGIKDIKTVSQFVTLAELGMDSMMGTEIIQLLEKDFEIYITPLDLRSLTFAKLIEMEAEKMVKTEDKVLNKFQDGKSLLIRYIPDGAMSHLPVRELNNQVKLESAPVVFVLPGMEGTLDSLEILTNSLKARVIGIQYSYENPEDCVQNTAKNIVPHLEKYLSKNGSFIIIGYSFGAIIALELTSLLEGEGYSGTLICIEGSPTYLSSSVKTHFTYQDEDEFQTEIIIKILSFVLPLEILSDHKDKLRECKSLEERLEFIFGAIPNEISNRHKLEKQSGIMIYKHMKAMVNYNFTNEKIKSLVYLFKATQGIIDEEEDYQLSKVCEQSVEVTTIKGDHATMLSDPHLVENVNKIITLNV